MTLHECYVAAQENALRRETARRNIGKIGMVLHALYTPSRTLAVDEYFAKSDSFFKITGWRD